MKIKEVEELTRLTSQTIRFYEDKKLLNVGRNESGYREYTEENIDTLFKIKMLRKCGLSIQEISQVIHQKMILEDLLYQKISDYEKKDLELSNEKELCLQVIKAKGNYQSLYKDINYLESSEYNELIDDIIQTSHVSLARQIFMTLPLLGPILCSYLFLYEGQYQRLEICLFISFIAVIILTLSWSHFLKEYRFQKERLWNGFLHFLGMLLMLVILLIIMFGSMILLNGLQIQFYMSENVYILSQPRLYSFLYILFALEIAVLFLSYTSRFLKHHDYQDYNFILPFVKRHIISWILVNIFIFYIAFSHVTTVSRQSIIHYSFLHPLGIEYQLSDIEKVETGFHKNGISFLYDAGDFYYKVTMKDGVTISFEDCQTIKEFEDDTYREMVFFDQQVMQYHPQKISSTQNSEYLMLDQIYIDRFISIIENK